MHFLPEKIEDYAEKHSMPEPNILKELQKETWQKVLQPRMLSGHFQGRLISLISKLKSPQHILEIGTYTGYSTICLAEGLKQEGIIHTIDKNEELEDFQRKYFDKSGFGSQIIQHVGLAKKIIPTINELFDLVFIDADKTNYKTYFDLILPKCNSGALILSDNVLWSGKVVEKLDPKDKDTAALLEYNSYVNTHEKVETVLLPIRDGLTLTRVK